MDASMTLIYCVSFFSVSYTHLDVYKRQDLPKAEEMNYALGTQMKGCVDFAILVGDRRAVRPILKGILSTGFPRSAVRVVADSDDAEAALDEVASEGDTVLYECECEEA